jgi:hypothetical protein
MIESRKMLSCTGFYGSQRSPTRRVLVRDDGSVFRCRDSFSVKASIASLFGDLLVSTHAAAVGGAGRQSSGSSPAGRGEIAGR